MPLQQGDRIGDYEILSVLGKGGMGQVYKVRNVISERIEAMKVLLPSLEGSADLVDRFLREIKVQASLQHPNIAALHSAQRIDNQLLMFMEFLEGQTVEQELRTGSIPVARGVDYVRQVLAALAFAHSRGVIHRDIKPANMMVTADGVVKLMDFGIARVAAETKLTQTGQTMGSFYYMSPEQINGSALDERADLYSMGISLYEIVTGRVPFSGDSAYSVMAAHLHSDPTPPIELDPKLPDLLNEIILMSIAKEPARRFQSADAFGNALKSAAGMLGVVPARPHVAANSQRPAGAPSDGASRIVANPSLVSTRPVTPPQAIPIALSAAGAPSPAGGAAAGAAVSAVPPPARTSNLGLYVAIGLIVLVSAGGVAAWKGQLFHSSAPTGVPEVDVRRDPTVPPDHSAAPPQVSGQQAQQTAPAAATPPATGSQAAATQSGSRRPAEQPAAIPPRVRSAPEAPAAASPDSVHTATAPAPAQAAAVQSPAAPQEEDLSELRDLYNKIVVRATAIQEGLGRLEAQQRATGLGLRGDMVSAKVRMGVNIQLAEGALRAHDGARLKQYLGLAERDLDKLETFLGR